MKCMNSKQINEMYVYMNGKQIDNMFENKIRGPEIAGKLAEGTMVQETGVWDLINKN